MNTTTIKLADHVIAALRAHEAELRQAGIRHLSLFGSVARLLAHGWISSRRWASRNPSARLCGTPLGVTVL
jgi:hypothetical protein